MRTDSVATHTVATHFPSEFPSLFIHSFICNRMNSHLFVSHDARVAIDMIVPTPLLCQWPAELSYQCRIERCLLSLLIFVVAAVVVD